MYLVIADVEEGRLYQEETEPAGVFDAGLYSTALPHWQGTTVARLQQKPQALVIQLQQSPGSHKDNNSLYGEGGGLYLSTVVRSGTW